MTYRPLHDRLVVRRLDDGEQTIGGILIPDSANEKPQRGTVIAVGRTPRPSSTEPARRSRLQGALGSSARRSEDTTSDYEREKLQERLAKLVGGVAIIKVGAATETELKEKKARVEDAMHATKAAVEEGIVAGGGVALLRAAHVLCQVHAADDERVGVNIIGRAIEEPMRWIATNAGHEGSIVVQRTRAMTGNAGFNAQAEHYEDLVEAGVFDPTKVVRSALQNAASIASLLLTTEAVISMIPESSRSGAPSMSGMGGGGMY